MTADDENESRTPSILLYKQENKILMLIIRFIWLQKVLGLCDRSETGRLEKEKEKNEGVDNTPQCCALLRSTLRYYKNQITPLEKEKKKV